MNSKLFLEPFVNGAATACGFIVVTALVMLVLTMFGIIEVNIWWSSGELEMPPAAYDD